jgi:hypothetical protein
LCALLTVGLAACAGTARPPEPGEQQGTPPDLRGRRVMVLPFQENLGVPGDPDAEMAFGLTGRSSGVTWILPPELQRVVDRSPGSNLRIRALPVGAFTMAEVRRIGDPLYRDLRRLSEFVDAEVALLPVRAWTDADVGSDPTVRLSAALIHVGTGRVLWFGVVEGTAHPLEDPRGLASAVDRMARTLLWYAG